MSEHTDVAAVQLDSGWHVVHPGSFVPSTDALVDLWQLRASEAYEFIESLGGSKYKTIVPASSIRALRVLAEPRKDGEPF